MTRFNAWIGALAGTLVAAGAAAQTPSGLLEQKAASTGSTEVAKGGFEKITKPAAAEEATELKFSGGGLLATGNSRSLSLTGSGQLRLRRAENEYSATVAGNYGRSAASADESTKTSVENIQGRIRYDRFLSESWAVFVAQSARRDRFQGLDLRLNFDPGLAYYFFDVEKHRLWAELGYDLQYDVRNQDAIAAAPAGSPIGKTEVRHSGRAFAGYENNLNEAVRFNTGVEYIQAVGHTENWRLNWDAGLSSSISTSFSLATTFSLRYDHNPLAGVRNTDTITALNLVYQLL